MKHVVKEATRAANSKGKRGRKRKSDTLEAEEDTIETVRYGRKRKSGTLEADEGDVDMAGCSRKHKSATQEPPEPSSKVARATVTASVVQISGTLIAEDEIVLEL